MRDARQYLEAYADMIALGDGEFSTMGYAEDFVEGWLDKRRKRGEIVETTAGALAFSEAHRRALLGKLRRYASAGTAGG